MSLAIAADKCWPIAWPWICGGGGGGAPKPRTKHTQTQISRTVGGYIKTHGRLLVHPVDDTTHTHDNIAPSGQTNALLRACAVLSAVARLRDAMCKMRNNRSKGVNDRHLNYRFPGQPANGARWLAFVAFAPSGRLASAML